MLGGRVDNMAAFNFKPELRAEPRRRPLAGLLLPRKLLDAQPLPLLRAAPLALQRVQLVLHVLELALLPN